jgi:hypothetical protein
MNRNNENGKKILSNFNLASTKANTDEEKLKLIQIAKITMQLEAKKEARNIINKEISTLEVELAKLLNKK